MNKVTIHQDKDLFISQRLIWSAIYLFLIFAFHTTFVLFSVYIATQYRQILNIPWLLLSVLWWLAVAEKFSLVFTYLFVKTFSPSASPKLENLSEFPRVALLYCTKDDSLDDALTQLDNQTYSYTDVFILDDSNNKNHQITLEQYPYKIIRRDNRQGHKAGNLNHWLMRYGDSYQYFVVLDADSIIPEDFIEQMLLYAEHPLNHHVAMFESKIEVWQPYNALQVSEHVQMRIAGEINEQLLNKLESVLSNGHNNLCRIESLLAVGGFDERYVGEDHATTLNLKAHGFTCRVVDVTSYEIPPATVSAYKQRHTRWVRNDLQLLRHQWEKVPAILQFRMLFSALQYSYSIVAIPLMLYAVWGTRSEITTVNKFLYFFMNFATFRQSIMLIYLLMAIFVVYLMILQLPIVCQVNIKGGRYILAKVVSLSLGIMLIFPTVKSVIASSLNLAYTQFVVTPKMTKRGNLYQFLQGNLWLVLLIIVIGAGIVYNPLSVIFNWIWLIPLIMSPFVLFYAQGD